ncbi:MAG: two pore domain potassium channel family protein [Flavobacteriales bacterium]|nr:two pore domain potassium channel family protein [Flavobacteriales bacterium]
MGRIQGTVRKIVIGKGQANDLPRRSTIRHRWENLGAIWNNTYEEDAGLEKVVRLVLAGSQFLFPGLYIKHLFWRTGPLYQDLAIEVFVLFKTVFPLVVLHQGWEVHAWVVWLVVWLVLETFMYIPTLIFASDVFPTPRSYRRSKILIFLNYLEVVFTFAVLHMAYGHLNVEMEHWFDPVYYSFIVTSTIGFGDLYPITPWGKFLVVLQSLFYLSYLALFISFFSRGHNKGYFGGLEEK